MSFSNPTPTNPAEHFFEWRSGKVQFYDKEKKESIQVPLPFTFIVLDQLHTITGYSDEDESGFWSNELRDLNEDFNVRTKKGTQYYGKYKINGIAQVPTGARYTKSVYIAHKKKDGTYILGNLKLVGAALTAWIEEVKGVDFRSHKISITGSTEGKKGATTYQIPTFLIVPGITDEEVEIATELDKNLQAYLEQYLTTPKHEEVTPIEDDPEATSDQDVADFEQKRDEASKARANKEAAKVFDIDDDPISLEEIPF